MITARFIVAVCMVLLVAAGSSAWCESRMKPLVGVYYFPGWYRAKGISTPPANDPRFEPGEWRSAIMKAAVPRVLCGFYDDSDPNLWRYYKSWMTGSGIDFVAFDWYYNAGQEYLNESLDRGFVATKDPGPKFCIHWCNHGGGWWLKPLDQSGPALLEMTDVLCKKYFNRPDYLKIDGKPVLMVYDNNGLLNFGGRETVKANLQAIRERAKKHGFPDLYLVTIYPRADALQLAPLKDLGYDAFCAYTYAWMRGQKVNWDSPTVPYKLSVDHITDNLHPFLARAGKERGIPYWPTVFSGWDDRPRAGLDRGFVLTGSTPELFGKMLRSGLKNVNPASPVVMIEAWNEWGEGACIEPSKEHGFGYMREIAKARGITHTDESTPTNTEISSWCVLTADELKLASKNESKPWPVKETRYYKLAKSRDIPDVKLPVSIELAQVPTENFALSDAKIEGCDASGVSLVTTGTDPNIAFPIPEIPTRQIKRITIEADVNDIREVAPEVFFATALMPEFSQFAAVTLPPIKAGRSSISTSDIMGWPRFGTPLIRVRVDLGSEKNIKVHFKRVVFSAD